MFTKTTTKQLWDGNGVDGVFNITDFYFVKNEHVKISVYVGGASPAVEKTEDFDYTLTGAGDPDGGQITWIGTVPASGDVILAERVVPYAQESDYENFDGTPSDLLESDLDLAAMREQQLKDGLDRSVKVPVNIVGFNAELPATLTPGRAWKINASGDGIEETLSDPDDVAVQVSAAAASAAAAAASESNAVDSADAASGSATMAQSWAVDDIGDRPEGSAKYWAEQAELIATTGDYAVFSGTLTSNQATGVDPITLPLDPKIAARVDLALGGIAQIAGTDFHLDGSDTTKLYIDGGTSNLAGVTYGGRVQIPSSLTNVNAPSAGSVVTSTIQNAAVTFAKLAAAAYTSLASDFTTAATSVLATAAGVVNYLDRITYSTQAYNAASQSIPNGAVANVLTLPNEVYDDGGWHDTITNNHRITVDFTGRVRVTANGVVNMPGMLGYMKRELRKNGTAVISSDCYQPANNGQIGHSLSAEFAVVPGDYFDQTCYGNLGATTTVAGTVTLTVTRIK